MLVYSTVVTMGLKGPETMYGQASHSHGDHSLASAMFAATLLTAVVAGGFITTMPVMAQSTVGHPESISPFDVRDDLRLKYEGAPAFSWDTQRSARLSNDVERPRSDDPRLPAFLSPFLEPIAIYEHKGAQLRFDMGIDSDTHLDGPGLQLLVPFVPRNRMRIQRKRMY